MASIYLCQIKLGPLSLLPPCWLPPLIALCNFATDFHNTGCCSMSLIQLISHFFCSYFLRIKKRNQTPSQHDCIWLFGFTFLKQAISLSFIGDSWVPVKNKQLVSSCLCQILCNCRVSHPNIIAAFGALVVFTGCISFSLGYHTASTDLAHNTSILNFKQEIWDLQHKKVMVGNGKHIQN